MIGRGSRRPGTRGRRRSPRAVTAALVVLVALLGLPVSGWAAAAASAAGRGVRDGRGGASGGRRGSAQSLTPAVKPDRTRALVTLTQVSPTVVKSSTDVTIRGVVTAPLTGPLTTPTVQVRLADKDITTRAELDGWASGRTTPATRVVAETTLSDVAAGAEAPFSVVIPAGELRSPRGVRRAADLHRGHAGGRHGVDRGDPDLPGLELAQGVRADPGRHAHAGHPRPRRRPLLPGEGGPRCRLGARASARRRG